MDQFDVVRAFYRLLNRSEFAAAAALYDRACVTEGVFIDVDDVVRGGERNAERLREFGEKFGGGFPDGSYFNVRTIGGIGTGWGWVQADWIERVVERGSGRVRQLSGYSHFLVEDGRIRRHRTVGREEEPLDPPAVPRGPSDRHYPTRPVVGVGAVIVVDDSERQAVGWTKRLAMPAGVVLIKRRYEPLANQWSLPGGTLEVGETLEAGTAREIIEETGLVVSVGPVVDVFDRILFDAGRRVRYHFVLIDYLCRPVGGRLRPGSDVSDVALADPESIGDYGVTEKAAAVIRAALRMSREGEKGGETPQEDVSGGREGESQEDERGRGRIHTD